jgi:hypothetical protein
VNIRGNRNSTTITCDNQINSDYFAPPEEVTLSATGTVTTGNLTLPVDYASVPKISLLANPYPSPLSFSAFRANNTNINNYMFTYSPFGNGNYTTYFNGLVVNAAPGYDNLTSNYLASGQAFFVQANTSGNVTFMESHKATSVAPNSKYFGSQVNQLIRVGLKSTIDNSLLDEIIVRYDSTGNAIYTQSVDAISLSNASQCLASLKDSDRLAIATHPLVSTVDTTWLDVRSSVVGKYRLSFSDYQDLDSSKTIILVDKFLGTTLDVRANQQYDFYVTGDTASVGNNRFIVLVGAANVLPVNFTAISASKAGEKVNIKWRVANEASIAGYEVERSIDGTTFSIIKAIKSAGTSVYSLDDAALPTGKTTLYYRIRANSTDGTFKYSSVARVLQDNYKLSVAIYPNPVKQALNISFNNSGTVACTVRIANLTGNTVYSRVGAIFSDGKLSLDASSLSSGAYVLELTDQNGHKYQGKFVKE